MAEMLFFLNKAIPAALNQLLTKKMFKLLKKLNLFIPRQPQKKQIQHGSEIRKYECPWEAMEKAKIELMNGELQQASEKGWLATDIALKKLAILKGQDEKVLFSHANKRSFANYLGRYNNYVWTTFSACESLHTNFYTGGLPPDQIEGRFEIAEDFIKQIEGLEQQLGPENLEAFFIKYSKEETELKLVNIAQLQDAANRMRISSIEQTCKSNSGHPTSSCSNSSSAEIMATLFFSEMRYDVQNPRHPAADRFILSKGHACPILYAAWEEAGLLSHDQVLTLRQIDSDIEGHPTPRLNFTATGSLGQGLGCAAGMAYAGKYVDKASYRVYCLMGDGESAEGSVWEAASFASYYKLDNLVAMVDVNRLGQSQQTMLEHDLEVYANRFAAFGFHSIVVDGHDINALLKAYAEAKNVKGKPTAIIAKTFKGKGIEGVEDQDNAHGKPVTMDKADKIRTLLKSQTPVKWNIPKPVADTPNVDLGIGHIKMSSPPKYEMGQKVATRQAYGDALLKLADPKTRVIALNGGIFNSTFSNKVRNFYQKRLLQCYIAEENMVGVGVGLACRGRAIPHICTLASFFTRAGDQIRMAAESFTNVKFTGSHVGVSIGEDGPSQMGLEDLALFRALPDSIVLYPSDAVSAEYATELAINYNGITYTRVSRPNTPVIYSNEEKFEVGKCKVVRETSGDKMVLIGAGVTLYECMKAHDLLNSQGINVCVIDLFSVKPIDVTTIAKQAQRVGGKVLTVEDHYQAGGIGEAVAMALSDLPNVRIRSIFVKELPRSGSPEGLMDLYGLSAKHIVSAVSQELQLK